MGACAGIDWAKEEHAVVVADERGEPLAERVFAHDEEGIAALCQLLVRLAVERVAVERPDGLLVERARRRALRARLASQPGQGGEAALPLPGQVGALRRLGAVRARPHRRPPLPGARPGHGRHQGPPGGHEGARGPGRDPGSAGQPAAGRARALLARRRGHLRRGRLRDRAPLPRALPLPARRPRARRAAPRGVPAPPPLPGPALRGRAARAAARGARGTRRRA